MFTTNNTNNTINTINTITTPDECIKAYKEWKKKEEEALNKVVNDLMEEITSTLFEACQDGRLSVNFNLSRYSCAISERVEEKLKVMGFIVETYEQWIYVGVEIPA